MPKVEMPEIGGKGMDKETNAWTSGDWTVGQYDIDHIIIKGPYNQHCIMCGGDFESLLGALSDAYSCGKAQGREDALHRI